MKKFLLNMVLEFAFDEIIKALAKLARKSSMAVDDKMVSVLRKNKTEIIREVKQAI